MSCVAMSWSVNFMWQYVGEVSPNNISKSSQSEKPDSTPRTVQCLLNSALLITSSSGLQHSCNNLDWMKNLLKYWQATVLCLKPKLLSLMLCVLFKSSGNVLALSPVVLSFCFESKTILLKTFKTQYFFSSNSLKGRGFWCLWDF